MSTKHIKEVEELVSEYGFERVEHRKSGHLCLRHPNPDVHLVFAPTTPSDPRWREVLISKMRKALVEAGLAEKLGPMENKENNKKADEPEDENIPTCPHCDKTFDDGRGLSSHEDSCEKNPDRWKVCPGCGQPCKGKRGLARHLSFCEGEEEEEKKEPEKSPSISNEIEHKPDLHTKAKVRSLLGDLLGEYERIKQSRDGNLYLASSELNSVLDAYADLIAEECP